MSEQTEQAFYSHRVGWLRAAVLGANDGIVSTAALVVGVAASGATPDAVFISGVAGAVAGAMSMAAGEYVSVSSQGDSQRADLARGRRLLREDPEGEFQSLVDVYVERGLDRDLARTVVTQLVRKDEVKTHARAKLGMTDIVRARPLQAAMLSAVTFSLGALLPLSGTFFSSGERLVPVTTALTLVSLLLTGSLAAKTGGAPILRGALRIVFWGAAAMIATDLVGGLFDAPAG